MVAIFPLRRQSSFRLQSRREGLRLLSCAAVLLLALQMSGCGVGTSTATTTGGGAQALHTVSGKVYGGQQAVSGATISLYAAGKTGTASVPRSMLSGVTSLSDGSFSITGKYSCNPGDQVYIVAKNGSAGSGTNSAIGMMAALGPCSALLANGNNQFIYIDEVTTVASVYALSAFMTGVNALGSAPDAISTNALAAAFANVQTMVNTTTGMALTTSTGNGVVPVTTINSLANSLAECINSTSSTSSACNSLFSATTVGGTAPTDTIQAALNVALHPSQNTSQVFAVATSTPPFQPTLTMAPASYAITVAHPSDVLTYHNNVGRTGVQPAETTLTPANVTSAKFGKLRTFAVDGQMYAQPLYVGGVGMPDGAVHNLLIAATAHGTVYAFDADGNNPAAGYLWKQSMFGAGEAPVVEGTDYSCGDTTPESSLLGTPVIDRSTGTIYVVSTEKVTASGTFTQKLHALSYIDGSESMNGPVVITATYPGTGAGSQSGVETFDALKENQRPALLLSGGNVWITWASHCDIAPYHGYIMAYSASNVATRTVLYNNTPNGSDGGIWMSGGGPAADAAGYVYTVSGNGTFDANTGGLDYGDAGLKMAAPTGGSTTPSIAGYFVPYNQQQLSSADQDVGVTNALIFNDPASSYAPTLMVESDKTGKIYLLDTGHMGGYNSTANQDLGDFPIGGSIFNNFAYFNGALYADYNGGPVRAYAFVPGNSAAGGHFNTAYTSQAPTNSPGSGGGNGGVSPMVSANGTANGIVWTSDHNGNALLHAYDASNLATEFYNSGQAASSRDALPTPIKFVSPVIANGQVFVGGAATVAVYGLLP